MKTRIYIPTLLALIIQVIVMGQTQASYRSLSVLGAKKNVSQAVSGKASNINDKKDRVYPTLVSTEEYAAKPIQAKSAVTSQPAQDKKTAIDNNTFNYYNNAACYNTMVYATELLKQADGLMTIEKTLRNEAKTKHGNEKAELINSANELVKQAEIKQIQASEITGKISVEKFKENNITLYTLMEKSKIDERVTIVANDLNLEAKYSIKLAKEMREEAYSFKTNSAKLGTMNNAEEKEAIALNKQEAAITLIKSAIAFNNNLFTNDLAVK